MRTTSAGRGVPVADWSPGLRTRALVRMLVSTLHLAHVPVPTGGRSGPVVEVANDGTPNCGARVTLIG